MLCVVFLSFCTIIYCSLIGIYGLVTDVDDLVFEDHEIFTINASLDDDETEEDDSIEYTLEKPRFEDGLLEDYVDRVVEANIQHNKDFDSHSKKKQLDKSKRQIPTDEDELTWRYVKVDEPEIVYDYELFKNEFDEEIKKKQADFNETEFKSQPKSECAADKFYNKGFFTVKCLMKELQGTDENLKNDAYEHLVVIAEYWGVILLIMIVVGWAHLGYFNVCCPCSFCFPEDGYEEVKRYLVLNPPGVLVRNIKPKTNPDMKTVIEKEVYRPTETEHYLYNNIWKTVYNV